ncbi:hypothetical protein ABIE26_001945 [Pedobacter africanus]|uniref:Uncharacterized protein n=1 Tax=Pedobacter africanus TaxID=151894 RepID=A0ACC6KR14_9SPHI|nr:RagB/SusD family nutrient uptake outer membrane protein [Pedobacter africanus]MDR6781567.1 hypothetical protein [Pedobacter africanus]
MKYIQYRLLLLLLVAGTFISCDKQLNVYPTNKLVDGNVIIDLKSAETVLNGVYYAFAYAGMDNLTGIESVRWATVNEIMPSELAGTLAYAYGQDGFMNMAYRNPNNILSSKWEYGYDIVNAANGFLKNVVPVKNIPEERKKQMIAEAKFLRAFGNADLLFYFGQYYDINSKYGIILRNEFVSAEQIRMARSSVAASYNAILKDLDEAIADLPPRGSKIHYTNLWAAKMLKARVLINRGAAGDYEQVINLTEDIILNGNFKLEQNLKDLFHVKGFSSEEVMLAVQPFPTERHKFYLNNSSVDFYVTPALKDLLTDDPRKDWMYKDAKNINGILPSITKYYSGNAMLPVKTPVVCNSYAFRLTEAYLTQAEAITLAKGDLAKAKLRLTDVMKRAGLTDFSNVDKANTPEALQFLIVQEVRKNFLQESGLDWFAMRRLPMATLQSIRPAVKSRFSFILPIPMAEMSANGLMEPNPAE